MNSSGVPSREPISTSSDWNFDLLETYHTEIARIAANFGLENNNEGQGQENRELLDHPVQGVQPEKVRQQEHQGDAHNHARKHLSATRSPQKKKDIIEHQRQNADFQHLGPAEVQIDP